VKRPTGRWKLPSSKPTTGASTAATGGEGGKPKLGFLGIALRASDLTVDLAEGPKLVEDLPAILAAVFV
jgi:hypothetical protein